MVKPVEVTVNGRVFIIQLMDPFDGVVIFGDLQRELLPALVEVFAAAPAPSPDGKPDPEQASKDAAAMAKGVEKLSSRLDGKQLKHWMSVLLTKDTISVELDNGNVVPFDDAARAMVITSFTEYLELLFQVIKVNFAEPLKVFLNRSGLDVSALTRVGMKT